MRIMPFMKRKKGIQFAGLGIDSGGGGDTSALANKTDLTAIILTGTTNTSGDVISTGAWFYLNGTPCVAKVDIASGATFTVGTNYEEKTVGSALSELNSNLPLTTGNFYTQVMFGTSPNANGFYISNALTIPYRSGFTLNSVYKIDGESSSEIAAQIFDISDKARLYYLSSADNSVAGKIATVHLTLT